MTFTQELFGLFGINLKFSLKINIFTEFVIFVHTSTSGNAKKRRQKTSPHHNSQQYQ